MGGLTVQRDRLDRTVGPHHDRAARRFVRATALHADVSILDDVETTDAVLATDPVELGQHLGGAHSLAVDGHDVALVVGELDVGGLVRRSLGAGGPTPHLLRRLEPRILERSALVADVQQVGVHRERRLLAPLHLDRNLVLGGVRHQRLARAQVPFTPRCDHGNTRLQRIGAELEPNLVVALSGCAVADGVGAGCLGDLHEALRNQRTGDRGTQQVLALVDRVGPEHRIDVVTHELFAQVLDVDLVLGHTHCERLRTGRFDLFALPEVGGEGDHVALVGLLKPLQDDRRVQTTGVGQDHLVDLVAHRLVPLCGRPDGSGG